LRYRFEDYLLDIDRRELRNGEAVVPVEPQVFDLLAFLIEHRERVVSRDELLASVWEGRSVSESTFTSRINAVRSALGDSGEEQRLIRTVPRRGYRFVGDVRGEGETAAVPVVADSSLAIARRGDDLPVVEILPTGRLRLMSSITVITLSAVAAVGVVAAALLALSWAFTPARKTTAGPRFDPSVVPIVSNEVRRALSSYPQRPDAKALAIGGEAWSVADGAASREEAEKEALRQCAVRAKVVCRLYASGMEVVWSKNALPMAAAHDLRSEPLEAPLIVDEIPTLSDIQRKAITDGHVKGRTHKALALTSRGYGWANNMPTRDEPTRVAVERCAEVAQRPCLLLAVDGFLTIRIPKSRRIERIFLPSVEDDIPVAERERISRTYQGAEWRALARGKNGTWYPFVAAPTEAAAVEGALKSCQESGDECRLYAIGNFRVAEE
jgi:DNA-binding winged helix-turn-helix (wHTH) protein